MSVDCMDVRDLALALGSRCYVDMGIHDLRYSAWTDAPPRQGISSA